MPTPVSVSINLFCNDLERLFGFYRDVFDLSEIAARHTPIYRALLCGGVELGFHAPAGVPILNALVLRENAPAVTHYPTFDVDSEQRVDALCLKAVGLGARVLKDAYLTYYNAWQVVLTDPEGNFFRINFYR